MWVLVSFLPPLSGAAAPFSRGDPCPVIRSLSLRSRVSASGFLLRGLAASQLLLLPRSWKKDQNCELDSFSSLPPPCSGLFTPFLQPPRPTLFHFTCPKPYMVMVLPVGLWLSKDLATPAGQLLGSPFGQVGIPTPGSVPRHRKQGVRESSGHTGCSCKGHTVPLIFLLL